MKRVLLIVAIALMVVSAPAQSLKKLKLPELHKIKTVTLSPPYGCRSAEDSQKGYESTALFLSAYSKNRNSPDLLFNGACGGPDFFQVSMAGDDMALIADIGDIALEEVSAAKAFNTRRIFDFSLYSRFSDVVPVRAGATYAVLVNKSEIRGLFIFTVTNYVPSQQVDLRYAVKEYQVLGVTAQSPGFNWDLGNQQ